jgi:hypothetical protein
MEIMNFEKVCSSYEQAMSFKQRCERVYSVLKESGKEMTATEIAKSIIIKSAFDYSYHPTIQSINACIKKLKKLNLITRREETTDKKITINPKNTWSGYIIKRGYQEIFDKNGNSLGRHWVEQKIEEPFEINEKRILFSIKNT